MKKKLEAAETWFIRRIKRIPWVERKTNQEVLQMAGVTRELMMTMATVRSRQLGYLGRVLRGDGPEGDCLLGVIEGKRGRGRQRVKSMDGIREMAGKEEEDGGGSGEVVQE